MNTNIKQEERIAALEKRIAEAGDDFVSLTLEEYELLLSRPIGTVDGFEPLTTTAGGIMVGGAVGGIMVEHGVEGESRLYKADMQTIFPKIPNIGEGEVFVIFDFVKGANGLDFLNRRSNWVSEIEEGDFTQLALHTRTAGLKSYWYGSRYVNLRDPKDGMTDRALGALGGKVKVSAVSGKVIMHLPTNITGLTLAKGDIGVEKPFAGGVITLKEIKDDYISFQFTGDGKKIYAWTVYDDKNTILGIEESLLNDGIYQLYAEHPQSVKVYQVEIVRKEYPFAFGNESHATSEVVSSVEEEKPAPFHLKTATVDNLNLKCTVKDSKVKIRINGENAGEIAASGGGEGGATSGLGTYGALPGENVLELLLSEVGPAPEVTCYFLDKKDFSDENPKVLYSIHLGKANFTAKKYATRFVLEAKGYYPSLEASFAKVAIIAKEKFQDDKTVGRFMQSIRKAVMRAAGEQEAKKILDDLLSQ